jgi:hypothetical protein
LPENVAKESWKEIVTSKEKAGKSEKEAKQESKRETQ